jgi:membrane associated rhomboid family serine protease
MMTRGIVIFLVWSLLTGCANFAASVGGTFVGNIASDRVIKDMEKKK